MMSSSNTWVILLAAGDGTRLSQLTRGSDGVSVPKQYCSLQGGASLLQESLRRADAVARRRHICAVVSHAHQRWWRPQLWSLPRANIVDQPANRGTAWGILLPLLELLARDPQAVVVLLPCDHHVRNENVLTAAIDRAVHHVRQGQGRMVLLGIEPDCADPELGYIVPDEVLAFSPVPIRRFIEKPTVAHSRELIGHGALWNAFIVIARGAQLRDLIFEACPVQQDEWFAVLGESVPGPKARALRQLYAQLPSLDFSRDVLQALKPELQVLAVPACGWSDLGTPERLGVTLQRLARPIRNEGPAKAALHPVLAHNHAQWQQQQTNQ